jgi:hypothetical protein
MGQALHVREFIYLDVERLKSILAQLNEGLPESRSEVYTESDTQNLRGEGGIPGIFKAGGGSQYLWQKQSSESQTLHDHIYNYVERLLRDRHAITEIPGTISASDYRHDAHHRQLNYSSFILVHGRVFLNDYSFLRDIVVNFNDLMKSLTQAQAEQLAQQQGLNSSQRKVLIKESTRKAGVDENMLKFVKHLVDTFFKDRITVKMTPFDECPEFRFAGPLKRDNLRDNIHDIIFKFGTAPNHPWYMFAQVASIPRQSEEAFTTVHAGNALEAQFQQVFDNMREIEKLGLSVAHPEIAVTPIAIYRE